jgi:hypothetical protein
MSEHGDTEIFTSTGEATAVEIATPEARSTGIEIMTRLYRSVIDTAISARRISGKTASIISDLSRRSIRILGVDKESRTNKAAKRQQDRIQLANERAARENAKKNAEARKIENARTILMLTGQTTAHISEANELIRVALTDSRLNVQSAQLQKAFTAAKAAVSTVDSSAGVENPAKRGERLRALDAQSTQSLLETLSPAAESLKQAIELFNQVRDAHKQAERYIERLPAQVGRMRRGLGELMPTLPANWTEMEGMSTLKNELDALSNPQSESGVDQMRTLQEKQESAAEKIRQLEALSEKTAETMGLYKKERKSHYNGIAERLRHKLNSKKLKLTDPLYGEVDQAINIFSSEHTQIPAKIKAGDLNAIENFESTTLRRLQEVELQLDQHFENIDTANQILREKKDEINGIIKILDDEGNQAVIKARNALQEATGLASEGKVADINTVLEEALSVLQTEKSKLKTDRRHEESLQQQLVEYKDEFSKVKQLTEDLPPSLIPRELLPIFQILAKGEKARLTNIKRTSSNASDQLAKIENDIEDLGKLRAYHEAFSRIIGWLEVLPSNFEDKERLLLNTLRTELALAGVENVDECTQMLYRYFTNNEIPHASDSTLDQQSQSHEMTDPEPSEPRPISETYDVDSARRVLSLCKDIDDSLTSISQIIPNIFVYAPLLDETETNRWDQILNISDANNRALNSEHNEILIKLVEEIDTGLDDALSQLNIFIESETTLAEDSRNVVIDLIELLEKIPINFEYIDTPEDHRNAILNFIDDNNQTLADINAEFQERPDSEPQEGDIYPLHETQDVEQRRKDNIQKLFFFALQLAEAGKISDTHYRDAWNENRNGENNVEEYQRISQQAVLDMLRRFDLWAHDIENKVSDDDEAFIVNFIGQIQTLQIHLQSFDTAILDEQKWQPAVEYIRKNLQTFIEISKNNLELSTYVDTHEPFSDSLLDIANTKASRTRPMIQLTEGESGMDSLQFSAPNFREERVREIRESHSLTELGRIVEIYTRLENSASILLREQYADQRRNLDIPSKLTQEQKIANLINNGSAAFIFDLLLSNELSTNALQFLDENQITKVLEAGQKEILDLMEELNNRTRNFLRNIQKKLSVELNDNTIEELKRVQSEIKELYRNQLLYLDNNSDLYIMNPDTDLNWLYRAINRVNVLREEMSSTRN